MKDFHLLQKKLLKKSNRFVRQYYWFFIPGFLWYTIVLVISFTVLFHVMTSFQVLKNNPFATYVPSSYPIVSYSQPLSGTSLGIAVLDASSHTFMYTKNERVRFSPASTTKLMSALVARSFWKPGAELPLLTWEDPEGSGIALQVGEKLSLTSLLQAMLMYSANDAAFTVAQNYSGGEAGFVRAMNDKAQELHLDNTQFGDPAGLDDSANYTTPNNMLELAAVAMTDPLLSLIVNQKTAVITDVTGTIPYALTNRNILLGQAGVTGIKTGFTDEAKEVLLTRVQNQGHTFYIVVMKSDDRFGDTLDVIHKVLDHTTFLTFHP